MPFWSSLSRAKKIVANVPAYAGFEPVEMSWKEFRDEWLPQLAEADELLGVNWNGPRAVGYDLPGETVKLAVEHYLKTRTIDG